MATSLRDDLASLKIDRGGRGDTMKIRHTRPPARRPSGGGGGGGIGGFFLRILSFFLWMVPLAAISYGGYYAYLQVQSIKSKPEVQVGLVQAMTAGEAEKVLSAKGYLKSQHQTQVGAKIPGRLEKILVEEGQPVKQGQLLAIIEHNDLLAQLRSRKAQLMKAEADVMENKADTADKRRKAERNNRLSQKGLMATPEETESAIAAFEMAKARGDAMAAQIEFQKAMISETEESIRNMHITAPFDATVVEKPAEVGEMITGGGFGSGLSIGRSYIVTLANLQQMDVETDVTEGQLSRIAVGQPAEVSVNAVPNKRYRGRVRQIIPLSDRARATVKVKVSITDPDKNLFPELVATVNFLPDKARSGPDDGKTRLFVPKDAVFEEGGKTFVWRLVTRDNSIRKVAVELGEAVEDLARVEKGLEAGDRVVLSPAKTLQEGEPVRLSQ